MDQPNRMSPRQRVEAALLGHTSDMIPFTIYANHLPTGAVERQLRNEGLCLVQRQPSVYQVESPNTTTEKTHFTAPDGTQRIRTTIQTPAGALTAVRRLAPVGRNPLDQVMPWTSWRQEYPFKGPADYDPLISMIVDRCYRPNYEVVQAQMQLLGDDAIMRAQLPYSPLQEIIYNLLGVEQFALEWRERRALVLQLYDALTEDRRKIYPLVAQSPTLIANYGGNVSPEVVGLERFERYILPHYDEAADILHTHGKLLGVHFDANVRLLAPGIARSKIDYIEAFTPAPGSDMTLAEARAAWPDKIIWINVPSMVHLQPPAVIAETTRQLLRQAAPGDRFLIGITEDVPADRWPQTFTLILRTIHEMGRLPII